ncbi:hypothetical protein EGW08_011221, partial [Elysia chlorotica]
MGKGGPRPAYHAQLGQVLVGAGSLPDEEDTEANGRDESLLPSQFVDFSGNKADSEGDKDEAERLLVEEEEPQYLSMCIEDGEAFSRPKLTDHERTQQNESCLTDKTLVSDAVDWNINAHESVSEGEEISRTQSCHTHGAPDSREVVRESQSVADSSRKLGTSGDPRNDSGVDDGVLIRTTSATQLVTCTEQNPQSLDINIATRDEILNPETNCDEELGNRGDECRDCPCADDPTNGVMQFTEACVEQMNIVHDPSENEADLLRSLVPNLLDIETHICASDCVIDCPAPPCHETQFGNTMPEDRTKISEENYNIPFEGSEIEVNCEREASYGSITDESVEAESSQIASETPSSGSPENIGMPQTLKCVDIHKSSSSINTSEEEEKAAFHVDPEYEGSEALACGDQPLFKVPDNSEVTETITLSKNKGVHDDFLINVSLPVVEDKEITENQNSCTTTDEDASKLVIDDSIVTDEPSSLYTQIGNEKDDCSLTPEMSEKTLPGHMLSSYLSSPTKRTENNITNLQCFELPKSYNIDTVLAKLDATISSENTEPVGTKVTTNTSFHCTDMFPTIEFDPFQTDSKSKQDGNNAGNGLCTFLTDHIKEACSTEIKMCASQEIIAPPVEEIRAPATEKTETPTKEEIGAPALEEIGTPTKE